MGFSLEEKSDNLVSITDQFLRLASALRLEINQGLQKKFMQMIRRNVYNLEGLSQ